MMSATVSAGDATRTKKNGMAMQELKIRMNDPIQQLCAPSLGAGRIHQWLVNAIETELVCRSSGFFLLTLYKGCEMARFRIETCGLSHRTVDSRCKLTGR